MSTNAFMDSARHGLDRYRDLLDNATFEKLWLASGYVTDAEGLRDFTGALNTETMAASVEQDAAIFGVATAYNFPDPDDA